MTSDPLDILVKHNHWATGVVLDWCVTLTDEQFHRRFPIGLGSLHDTVDHIIGCMEGWTAKLEGQAWPRDKSRQSVVQLRARLDAATARIAMLIDRGRSPESLSLEHEARMGGVDYRFTSGVAIIHLLTHGHYHRAQAINMLRQLDLGKTLPELDVTDWHYETEFKK